MFVIEQELEIVIPTFNRRNNLVALINKILNSPINKCRVTILDNNSNDGTEQYCRELIKEHENIKYIKNKYNIGMAGNFTKALMLPEKKYFWMLFDDTDLFFSNFDEALDGMKNDFDIITTLNFYNIKHTDTIEDKARLIFMLITMHAGIFKSSLITENVILYAMTDTYTIHPQLSFIIDAVESNPKVLICKKPISERMINPEHLENKAYSFNRAKDNAFYHFRLDSPSLFLCGYLLALEKIKNKKLKKECICLLFKEINGVGPIIRFNKNFFKIYKYHKVNWWDTFLLLPKPYKYEFLLKSIFYKLTLKKR